MSEAESPERSDRRGSVPDVTIDDVRELMGASTPHFALQIRNRIAKLVRDLPAEHPARILGEQEIARLTKLGFSGETRGTQREEGIAPLASVSEDLR
ncbi:hypothetical protein GKE82_22425 [Conexibacter sp. W3-3-2]|uniref:Uncharacterized protein n=1 Tax=Paraconexibacter algicola TaxID=2133960 RepID=A0A2T4UFA9_9ACTN|nr:MULTISPECIES: hypothetical protein [Solirubrobacterales]MTD46966.1 hypothetical protein [Conexibacter sp. W3-3-2]PTL56466.1 hypothetical protein C7Y72_16015 [Paraconexibacter algicola]